MKSSILKTAFLWSLTFVTTLCTAQTWAWARSCGVSNNDRSEGTSVHTDAAGNVFATGFYSGTMTIGSHTLSSPGAVNAYLIKYDNNGNVLWARSPSPCAPSFTYNTGSSVCSDANGNAFITGICYGTSNLTTFLMKYDASGTVLWTQNISDANYNIPYSVACDASNNVYISGVFFSSVVFGTTTLSCTAGGPNLYLVKYDPNGNVLWARTNSSGGINQDFYTKTGVSLAVEPNGDVFITGSFTLPPFVLGTHTLNSTSGFPTIFLAKYDASGNALWAKRVAGTAADHACAVSADGVGNAYITGYFESPSLAFGSNAISNPGFQNIFLAKYDGNGNNLWVKNSTDTLASRTGYSVSSDSASVFVAGYSYYSLSMGTITFYPHPSSSPFNSYEFITKFDANGNMMYGQVMKNGADKWISVCADKFCNLYITSPFYTSFTLGNDTLATVPYGEDNAFIAKLSFSSQCVNGIHDIFNSGQASRIYPNPNPGLFNLQMEDNGELILYNCTGQQVYRQKVTMGANKILATELASGLYHYAVLHGTETIYSGKMVIE